jgi:hypothetical protein
MNGSHVSTYGRRDGVDKHTLRRDGLCPMLRYATPRCRHMLYRCFSATSSTALVASSNTAQAQGRVWSDCESTWTPECQRTNKIGSMQKHTRKRQSLCLTRSQHSAPVLGRRCMQSIRRWAQMRKAHIAHDSEQILIRDC